MAISVHSQSPEAKKRAVLDVSVGGFKYAARDGSAFGDSILQNHTAPTRNRRMD
jgi:hypothetical protein